MKPAKLVASPASRVHAGTTGVVCAGATGSTGALASLVRDGNAVLIGPIRQELLSGIREQVVFERLREALRAFPDEPLATDDFEEAARASNVCRSSGIAGSAVDFLICAVALRRKLAIFTLDRDFDQYAKHLPLRIHEPR